MCVPCVLDVTPPGSLGSSPTSSSFSGSPMLVARVPRELGRSITGFNDATTDDDDGASDTIEDEITAAERASALPICDDDSAVPREKPVRKAAEVLLL